MLLMGALISLIDLRQRFLICLPATLSLYRNRVNLETMRTLVLRPETNCGRTNHLRVITSNSTSEDYQHLFYSPLE